MPAYRYSAVRGDGTRIRGVRDAAGERVLAQVLQREGLWLVEAREIRTRAAVPVQGSGNARVPRRTLASFFLSVGLQLRSGMTVYSALALGVDREAHRGFRAVHADLLERVRGGGSLSGAMAAHPRTFSKVVLNLVRAGEAGGQLAEACDEIRAHYEASDRMASDVRQALLYPIAVLVAVVLFFFIVFSFFIPRFTGVLKELGVPLPALTRVMIATSEFLKEHHLAILAGVVAVVALAVAAFRKIPVVATVVDATTLRLPLFGPIVSMVCLARLAQNLGSLYRAGVPLLEALQLCGPIVGNRVIQEGVHQVADGVRAGRSMHQTMRSLPVFPSMVVQMVALGESTGALGQSLQNLAGYYDQTLPRSVKKLFSMLEPMMVLGLIALVGVVALSVVLPIAAALEAR